MVIGKSLKMPFLAILKAMNFGSGDFVNANETLILSNWETLGHKILPKLISRKISVAVKFLNFHNVISKFLPKELIYHIFIKEFNL